MGVFFFKVLRGTFKVRSSKNIKKSKVHTSKDRKKNKEVRQEQHEASRPADTPATVIQEQHETSRPDDTPARVRQEQPRFRKSRPADSLRYHGWSWPHVVGLTAREAERIITRDCPGVYCEVASVGQLLTMCYSSARVRLVVDRYGSVVEVPHVG